MPHKTSAFCAVIAVTFLATGCTHHQLQHNTVNQAETVADVHTRQVLDNLAKFADNPNALPHFSWPNAGGSNVNDNIQGNAGFNFTPHTLSGWLFGVGGSRTSGESYTMTPINDPRKLELMRCAYQRAINSCCTCGGSESGNCPNCQKRFNKFYLGSTSTSKIQKVDHNGNALFSYLPQGSLPGSELTVVEERDASNKRSYRVITDTHNLSNEAIEQGEWDKLYVDNDVTEDTQRTGKVTAACLHGECWLEAGSKLDIPKHLHSKYVGRHGETCVWVDDCGHDKLTQLTLTILDIALNDPPASATKEVVAYLDKDQKPATRSTAAYKVTANIPLSRSVGTLLPAKKSLVEEQLSKAKANQTAVAIALLMTMNQSESEEGPKALIQNMGIDLKSITPDSVPPLTRLLTPPLLKELLKNSELKPKVRKALTEFQSAALKVDRLEQQLSRQRESEQRELETLPPQRTPVPNAGFLQFQQNLRTLTP